MSFADAPPRQSTRPPQPWKNGDAYWRYAMLDPWYHHLVLVQHQLQRAVHEFFMSERLTAFLAPVTTGSVSSPMGLGSDSLPVEVDLLGVKTYLADSMQFMLELGCRQCNDGVYYLMPSFRGEATDQYHLAQFFHAEAEIHGQLPDVVRLASGLVHAISKSVLATARDSIVALAGSVDHIERLLDQDGHYQAIRMEEAQSELRQGGDNWIKLHPAGFEVLTKAGEAELFRRYGPIWITHFDHCSVPFYQAFEPGTKQAMNADLILGQCETIGAGQRHVTSTDVRMALTQHGVSERPYEWYLSMREIAPMQTSGFGMGLERYLLWLLNHNDIRDLTVIYRENGREAIP